MAYEHVYTIYDSINDSMIVVFMIVMNNLKGHGDA